MSPTLVLVLALLVGTDAPAPPAGPGTPPGQGLESVIGVVQVGRGATAPQPYILREPDGASLRLVGDLTGELARLQSARVEVIGSLGAGHFLVSGYRIVALEGGVRPLAVGRIVPTGAAAELGLDTDSGPPLRLNARSKLRLALSGLIGARIWVVGQYLLSGELRVERYGVLREPPPRTAAPVEGATPPTPP